MHARLDHRLAPALRREPRLDRGQDLVVGQRERRDVGPLEVVDHQGVAGCGVAHGHSRVYKQIARELCGRDSWRLSDNASTIDRATERPTLPCIEC